MEMESWSGGPAHILAQPLADTCEARSKCPGVLAFQTNPSGDTGLAQDRVQSFLWNITQQGNTFVPGKESKRGRAKRVKKTIQAVDHQFPNPHVAHQQGHGAEMPVVSGVNTTEHQCAVHNGTTANLNGVGQQLHGYTRH
ncbi:hypothetical protein F5883DRAFT_643600 [Diaporthe sp. PMI_573]|nr:hypothetical protein F5883DRAFT_643600 [Diaporthaceae sp. PMI_573]